MAAIRKRKNGKYEVQVRRKGVAPASRTFHTRKDAEAWARHTEIKADRGELPAPVKVLDKYSVRDILERYRDEVVIKKRGAKTETYFLNAFMRHSIANLTLAQVTPAHFSKYRDKRLKTVQPVTVNRELGIIKHAFDVAEREWDIPLRHNPLGKLRKLKVNNARNRRLEAGEVDTIQEAVATCRNPFIQPIILLALETAMRRGELLAMQWQHVDFDARTVFIPVTKNGHSRTIPLTSEALRILQDIQAMDADDKAIFPGVTANAVDHAWDRLVIRAGIENLHFHDLRHEAISRFFERGLSVPEVALISGHRDFRMLFRYTHLKAEDVAAKLI